MSSDPEYMKRYREAHPEYVQFETLRRRAQTKAVRRLRERHSAEYREYYVQELTKLAESRDE
jgi:hypothetical protein